MNEYLFKFDFISNGYRGDVSKPILCIWSCGVLGNNRMRAMMFCANKYAPIGDFLFECINIFEWISFVIIKIRPCANTSIGHTCDIKYRKSISHHDIGKINFIFGCWSDFKPYNWTGYALRSNKKKRNDIFFHVTKVTQEKVKVKK
jgi:hypothetical protein